MVTIEFLYTWSPFMFGGFAWNICIAVVATVMGTMVGAGFALMRLSALPVLVNISSFASSFFRNVPSLVLLFYLATLIPNSLALAEGVVIPIPAWFKASIALAASPIGFTSWNLYSSIQKWTHDDRKGALLFVPNWLSGFTITLLASSTSSLVGVSELVGRSNTIITASGADWMLAVYAYAACIFVTFSYLTSLVIDRLRTVLIHKYT
jgi:polar amino acid transport system permease protein